MNKFYALLFVLFGALSIPGCAALAAAAPYLAEAGVILADATNAVNAADDLLPSLHLTADEETKAEAVIAKARATIAAAAATDNSAKDLTAAQLDASLAEFRAAWSDVQSLFASKHLGAAPASDSLPSPLAMKRAYQ